MSYLARFSVKVLIVSLVIGSGAAMANPQGGNVVAGSATIISDGNTLNINQASDRAVIDWNSFSINASEITRFNQPAVNSAILNRVMGGNPSALYGTLSSNGQVFLINPNGIIVGPDGVINADGGFVGSTLNVPDSEFLSGGELNFSGNNFSGIENYGTISSTQGDVTLLGYFVKNEGAIDTPQGGAYLGAGLEVLLKASGPDRLYIKSSIKKSEDEDVNGVEHSGVINAASAELKAAGGNVYALSINNAGTINATGFENKGGRIVLTAADGNVKVGGTLTAKDGNGAGGEVLIGGEYQGGEPERVANARNTWLTEEAFVDVSADSDTGNGGRAIIWSEDSTYFYGKIDGRAGSAGGDGGFAEVSGKQYLDYQGLADLRAPDGKNGLLLLDPTDVEIRDGVGEQNVSGPAGNVIGSNGTSPTIINASTINTQLGLGDLTIQTNGAGAEPGDIIVNSAITWSSNNTLNFDAHNSIIINANITASGPSAILNLYDFNGASRGAGDITSAAGTTLTAFEINVATAGNVSFDGALDTSLLRINGITNGVGGSFSATNTANKITELSFASSSQMTGDVNIFDSAGGLGLRFSDLNTLGSVTIRTVADFNITGGPTLTAGGNVTFEAKGGTFAEQSGVFTITAPRYLVYADSFTQGVLATPDDTSFADFGSDPIGTGNVFYEPAAAAPPPPPPPEPDPEPEPELEPEPEPDVDGLFGEDVDQDQETANNLNLTTTKAQIVTLDFDTSEFEEEEEQQDIEPIDLSGLVLEITCVPEDCNFNTEMEIDLTNSVEESANITVSGTTVSSIQAVQFLGLNVPFGSEEVVEDVLREAFDDWLEEFPGMTWDDFLNAIQNREPEALGAFIGIMSTQLKEWGELPEGSLSPEQQAFMNEFKLYISMQRDKLAEAVQTEYLKMQSNKHHLSGVFRNYFPDIVTIARENLAGTDPERANLLSEVLTTTGAVTGTGLAALGLPALLERDVSKVLDKLDLVDTVDDWVEDNYDEAKKIESRVRAELAGESDEVIQKAVKEATDKAATEAIEKATKEAMGEILEEGVEKAATKLGPKLAAKLGSAGSKLASKLLLASGPVGIVIEMLSIGIEGVLNMTEDVKNENAYNRIMEMADQPVDLSTMDDVELQTYLTLMMAG